MKPRVTATLAALALGAATIAFATPASAATSTTTTLQAPTTFAVNADMPLRVQVTAASGGTAPTGTVRLVDGTGTTLVTRNLTPAVGGGFGWMEIPWSTLRLGVQQMRAVYTPATTDFTASQSALTGIAIVEQQPLAVLRLPDTFTVGTPSTLMLIPQSPTSGGTAAFLGNNALIAASTGTVGGVVTVPWTPSTSGNVMLTVQYTAADGNAIALSQAIFVNARR